MIKKRGVPLQTATSLMGIIAAASLALAIYGTVALGGQGALKEALTQEGNRIGELEALITELRTNLSQSTDEVVNLQTDLVVVDQTVDDLQNDLITFDQRVTDRESQVVTVPQDVIVLQNNLTMVDQRVSDTETQLADVPAVLTELWGAGVGLPVEHHRLFAYNRLTGQGAITGPKRDRIIPQAYQVFAGRIDRAGDSSDAQRGSLARFLMQNGNGTSKQPPDFLHVDFKCKAPVVLRPHPDSRIYITKTGQPPVDISDPNEYYSRPFDGTGIMYITTHDIWIGVGNHEVADAFNAFGVTWSGQTGVVAIDTSWFIDDLQSPVPLNLEGGPYEGQYHEPC